MLKFTRLFNANAEFTNDGSSPVRFPMNSPPRQWKLLTVSTENIDDRLCVLSARNWALSAMMLTLLRSWMRTHASLNAGRTAVCRDLQAYRPGGMMILLTEAILVAARIEGMESATPVGSAPKTKMFA